MNILIVNQHTLNYGDDIAGKALVQQLLKKFSNEKSLKINIIYNTHGEIEFNDERVSNRSEITLKKMGALNILFFMIISLFKKNIAFGSQMKLYRKLIQDSQYVFVSPSGANIGIYTDWRFLIKVWLVVSFNGTPIFHNNTIGKSKNILFNWYADKVLKSSNIYVREEASLKYLKSKKIFSIRSVDTGFLFENKKPVNLKEEKYNVFIPTQVNNWHPDFKDNNPSRNIENVFRKFLSFSENNNMNVKILPHLYGEKYEKKLLESFLEIAANDFPGVDTKIAIINCAEDYDNVIAQANFVLSMRYHGVVMAVKNVVPFISIAYENKMSEVCNYSGVGQLNFNLKDVELLNEINFNRVWNERNEIKIVLEANVILIKEACKTCLNQINFLSETVRLDE
ncbi:polysaccharide pyruvyl transferase family protein [Dellaglioa carnosa]|uniref:Polysaccharide pyruvyl transferase family protein n=1 Tax=Dellaglioa carnosa TaxID=2995136 RepID=A0ABT4JMK7_9LACO|nr:polysaccharide pyruvyl transferase family protein [Dellaglioa carnosa]MCZ2491593.1 polysaccharide pyruvyl transferase family protein [Dellaglioa carnosa]MCZ2494670.1 polysaccharide pyruvyl transferase family protein [Dellaglioa carnosa]MDK1731533.1 polysaccharide pyruvyl transferase family protein [Dellaglioa carnosa]